ncbi:MAG TPA: AraC family transcriptional regulator [Dongiaceae bacterium]|nr:AraC family transcriptional regulator [Dongiaceae bacterium]
MERDRDFLLTDAPAPGIERLVARFNGHAYDPHRHETYAIGETISGAQEFRYRGADRVSATGQIMVLHPDESHDGHAASPDGFSYRMIYADPALVRAALDPAFEMAGSLPFVSDVVSQDHAIAAVLAEAFAGFPDPFDPLAADGLIAGLADALAKRGGLRRRKHAQPHRAIHEVRALLDDAFAKPIASDDLERVAGLDRFTLARAFRAAFGTAPHRYLVARRVAAARRMIGDGVPLAETADACGFADQSHLNRHFKACMGVTPGRYARLIAQQAA